LPYIFLFCHFGVHVSTGRRRCLLNFVYNQSHIATLKQHITQLQLYLLAYKFSQVKTEIISLLFIAILSFSGNPLNYLRQIKCVIYLKVYICALGISRLKCLCSNRSLFVNSLNVNYLSNLFASFTERNGCQRLQKCKTLNLSQICGLPQATTLYISVIHFCTSQLFCNTLQ